MNSLIQAFPFKLKNKQSILNRYGFFSEKEIAILTMLDQLQDTKDKESVAFQLRLLRTALELINKPGLSKKWKKRLEHKILEKREEILKLLKKNKIKNTLEKIFDGVVKFGEELGELLMAILTGTHDRVFTLEELDLMQQEFAKNNQFKNIPRLTMVKG